MLRMVPSSDRMRSSSTPDGGGDAPFVIPVDAKRRAGTTRDLRLLPRMGEVARRAGGGKALPWMKRTNHERSD